MTTHPKRQSLTIGLIAIGLVLGVPLEVKFEPDASFDVQLTHPKKAKSK